MKKHIGHTKDCKDPKCRGKCEERSPVERRVVPLADIEAIEKARLLLHETFGNEANRVDGLMKIMPISEAMWKLTHKKYPAA